MKKNIYIITIIIFLSFGYIFSVSAGSLEENKKQVLNLSWGQKIVNTIDTISQKIVERSRKDDTFRRKVNEKISKILIFYKNKTDNKSQIIYKIFMYLNSKVTSWIGILESRILTRFQKVESDKNQNRAIGRNNKLKGKKYKRIYIKR